jgi:hypothetical protein
MYESGFIGLTITSLVWVGRLLLNTAFIARPFADALRSGEKKGVKKPILRITITPKPKTSFIIREIQKSLKSVIQNQALGVKFILKPDEMNDLTATNAIVSINREIYLYHGRANAIRPYNNGIL